MKFPSTHNWNSWSLRGSTCHPGTKREKINKVLQDSSKEESILSRPAVQCGRAAEIFGLFLSHSSDVKVQRLMLRKQAPPPSGMHKTRRRNLHVCSAGRGCVKTGSRSSMWLWCSVWWGHRLSYSITVSQCVMKGTGYMSETDHPQLIWVLNLSWRST